MAYWGDGETVVVEGGGGVRVVVLWVNPMKPEFWAATGRLIGVVGEGGGGGGVPPGGRGRAWAAAPIRGSTRARANTAGVTREVLGSLRAMERAGAIDNTVELGLRSIH
jgi:hypothetical protein